MSYLADYLDTLDALLRRYVVFRSDAQVAAVALWIVHTWAFESSDATPYLCVTSAERRSGKTRLLELLALVVRNPMHVAHTSAAALFRSIAEERPTLEFDEADAVFKRSVSPATEELRAVLNAGHRRGATVRRCVGEGRKQTVVAFDTFCPKVLAGIGNLPDTIEDRCIKIRMERRRPSDRVARFRPRLLEPEAADLRHALGEWAQAHIDYLGSAEPLLPPELDDRAQDGWEPLLAIADLAMGEWPDRARSAAVSLAQGAVSDDESLTTLALSHVREAFNGTGRMSTEDLLRALTNRDDAPWSEWWGRDVEDGRIQGPAARLSRLLRPFEIAPKVMKIGDSQKPIRGYERDQLESAWERYLPPYPSNNSQLVTDQVGTTSDVTSYDFSEGTEGATS
jgi:hypothetical protein